MRTETITFLLLPVWIFVAFVGLYVAWVSYSDFPLFKTTGAPTRARDYNDPGGELEPWQKRLSIELDPPNSLCIPFQDTCRPHFIVNSPAKSGTTYFQNVISSHPQVCMRGETVYMNAEAPTLDAYVGMHYRKHCNVTPTADTSKQIVMGEKSPQYFYGARAATNIRNLLPECRLLTFLRDPLERTLSQWAARGGVQMPLHDVDPGQRHNLDEVVRNCIEDYNKNKPSDPDEELQYYYEMHRLDNNDVCNGWNWFYSSLYSLPLRPFLEQFPRNQMLFLFTDDLWNHQQEAMDLVCRFLGIESVDWNAIAPAYERKQPYTLNFRMPLPMLDSTRDALEKFFYPYVKDLERLLGMDMSMWYSTWNVSTY